RGAIPGCYDDVRPPTPAEREAIAALPPVEETLARELVLGRVEGGGAERLPARISMPALNLDGLSAGSVGDAARNAIPTEATAALDIRLVPDQRPERIREAVEAHIRSQGFHIVYEEPRSEEHTSELQSRENLVC